LLQNKELDQFALFTPPVRLLL